MFQYYALSRMCYAFLRDVRAINRSVHEYTRVGPETYCGEHSRVDDCPKYADPEFARSRWHRRGWILQELLASQFLVFVSANWEVLGDKHELAAVLERITQIPQEVLRFEKDFADVSIAQRMSWAARRRTTRVEDQAYSLMGIFGINMPTLYGEGRMAFYRLQEEIMKASTDTSLFAWNSRESMTYGTYPYRTEEQTEFLDLEHLLAPDPSVFKLIDSNEVVQFNVSDYFANSQS